MDADIKRGRQIGKSPMPVSAAALQRPVAGIVAGDREAVLRSQACHLADPCLLPASANTATGMKVRPPLSRQKGKRIINNAAHQKLYRPNSTGIGPNFIDY